MATTTGAQSATATAQSKTSDVGTLQGFLSKTVFSSQPLPPITFADALTGQQVNVPPFGLGRTLWLTGQLSVTIAGTVTGGTWAEWPFPCLNWLKTIRFSDNSGTSIHNFNLHALREWAIWRYGIDPLLVAAGNYSVGTAKALGAVGGTQPVPGANIAAGTYVLNFVWPIPLAYNEMMEQGVILFRQNSKTYTLYIDIADICYGLTAAGGTTDIIKGLTGSGLSYTVAGSLSGTLDYCSDLPAAYWSNFATQVLHTVYNSQVSSGQLTNGGLGQYTVPQTEKITGLLLEFYNNGLPIPYSATAGTGITAAVMQYLGGNYRYQDSYVVNAARQLYASGQYPWDGVIAWDMGQLRGVKRRRDALMAQGNASNTTTQVNYTLAGLTYTAPSGINALIEMLDKQ